MLEAMFMREGEKVFGVMQGYVIEVRQLGSSSAGTTRVPSTLWRGIASHHTPTAAAVRSHYTHTSPLNTLAPAETHTQNERRRPQSSIRRHPRPRARHPPPGLRRHLWRRPPSGEAAGCQRREEGC